MKPTRTIRIDSDSIEALKYDSLFGDIAIEFRSQEVPFRLVIEEGMAMKMAADIIEKLLKAEELAAMWEDTGYEDI
jgi:hypothetical protein